MKNSVSVERPSETYSLICVNTSTRGAYLV